jgi:hypothetical protein
MHSFIPRHPVASLSRQIGSIAMAPAREAGNGCDGGTVGFSGESLAKKPTNPEPTPRR